MSTDKTNSQLLEQITKAAQRRWQRYPDTYRAPELRTIASWINKGESGCVVGLPGIGRSTLLGFLYHRPKVFAKYLTIPPETVAVIPIDLNILPDDTIATVYRVILRAFYRARGQFDDPLQQIITASYQQHADARDPFLPQSALLELLALFQARETRLIWILNHFDEFLKTATPEMARTLRSLRDSYKGMLCYLLGMLTEMAHLPDQEVGRPLYDILDINVTWVGPLSEPDTGHMIRRELRTAVPPPDTKEIQQLWQLTGGHPTLIRVVAHSWATEGRQQNRAQWIESLLAQRNVQYRLTRLWDGLTQEEQFALSELQKAHMLSSVPQAEETAHDDNKRQKHLQTVKKLYYDAMLSLQKKGVCQRTNDNWYVFSALFSAYVRQVEGRSRGRIWQDTLTRELFQGRAALANLTPLERETLRFFVQYPRVQHTYTSIFEAAWPEDVQHAATSNETIQQMIRGIRKKIEPNPSQPVYIVTWRGQPEGGYQFFPEGRPKG